MLTIETKPKRNTISLTPLIDVVFILLLFFMLSSNFFQEFHVELKVPSSGQSPKNDVFNEFFVDANDGGFMFQQQFYQLKDEATLQKLITENNLQQLALNISEHVSTQTFILFMDRLNALGVSSVSLKTRALE